MLPLFSHLFTEDAVSKLEAFGTDCVPLSMAAEVLNLIAQTLTKELRKDTYPLSDCLCETVAQSIVRHQDGTYTVESIDKKTGAAHYLHAKHVVLATGGAQRPWDATTLPSHPHILSTAFALSHQGVDYLKKQFTSLDSGRSPRIAIVGGSHSAWSAVWMLLNKVAEPAESALQATESERKPSPHSQP